MERLERTLDLWQLTIISVGIILGAGIYVIIGEAAGLSGNALWVSFIIASLVSVFTGLSYAELSSIFPKAGAEYVYVKKIFSKRLAFIVGWLILLNGIIGAATVSIGFANYFNALFGTPIIITALTLVIASTFVLFSGIKESAILTIIFTAIEAAGLAIIIFIGIPYIGSVDYTAMASGLGGVFQASALIFFAFMGFETITRLSEETRKPEKTVPMAVILSIAITTVIYILVGISAISVLGWEKLSSSESPMATIAQNVLGEKAFLILSLIALFSTSNTVLVLMLTTSRLIYGIAEFKTLPRIFLSIYKKTHVPWAAIMATCLLTMGFTLVGKINVVANLANFTIFVTFIVVNACVIWLRMKKKYKAGFLTPFSIGKIPILPCLGIITCLFMLSYVGFDILLYGAILIFIGFLIYESEEFAIGNHIFLWVNNSATRKKRR